MYNCVVFVSFSVLATCPVFFLLKQEHLGIGGPIVQCRFRRMNVKTAVRLQNPHLEIALAKAADVDDCIFADGD